MSARALSINCVIMRGGTSRAVFIRQEELPDDPGERERAILSVFGSPDRRQIDGVGGADPLTSKLAIIGRSEHGEFAGCGADLTYTFGQVEIERAAIDWNSLCGNISSAVGLFAIQEGLTEAVEPITRLRIYNTNLGRCLTIETPVEGGLPLERGDYRVPGVPGSGARILVDFAETAGGATGTLLPTGRPIDWLDVPGMGRIEATLIDIGNAHVFVRASDLDLSGTETAAQIDNDAHLREKLEAIRGAGAQKMGMIVDPSHSRRDSPATPILGMVAPPRDYADDTIGLRVSGDEVDLVSRLMFMQQMHKTYAGTTTVCTGVAARLPGTIVHEVARPKDEIVLRIGHPAGIIETETVVESHDLGHVVKRATLGRTARRIMEGRVFLPQPELLLS